MHPLTLAHASCSHDLIARYIEAGEPIASAKLARGVRAGSEPGHHPQHSG